MNTVTESIYSGTAIVPLADVSHIEHRGSDGAIMVVTKHSRWNTEVDDYHNAIYFGKNEAKKFTAAWCRYRSELEADTLMNLEPKD